MLRPSRLFEAKRSRTLYACMRKLSEYRRWETLKSIGPAVRQPDPEQAIGLAQARSFGASLVDRQLLAKRKILKDEAPAVGESQVEQSNEPENEGNHCYQSARTADPVVQGAWAQALQSKRLRIFGEGQPYQPSAIAGTPSGSCLVEAVVGQAKRA